ncbi:glgB [Symbiodinium sp. CCMP2456]|nr:glgB [Symbiodinium sp. CCMP2456]
MIYRNFGREEDGDKIMAGKGKLNEDGIALLRRLCAEVRSRHPGVILSAEESTNFKWVTDRPAENGTERHQAEIRDLGFHLKWNMGFAYDALSYFGADPEERPQLDTFGWKRLAWYLAYAFNERWVLPFSHDNMQPKSLLDQMAPNKRVGVEGQFAQLRLLFLYMVGMPGRPLMFMGSEIGEGFSLAQPVDWELAAVDPDKQQLRSWVAKLMKLYRQLKCLHRQEDRADGFHWLDKDSSSSCVYAWKRMAKDEPEAIIVVNASMTHVSPYYVNAGNTSGAWKCMAATALGDCATTPRSARVVMGRAKFATELPPMAAQIWVPCTCEEAVDEAALLNFEVLHQEAQPGDELRLVGNCPELGNWYVSEGVIMETDADTFPFWHTSMRIPMDVRNLEFKMVAVSASGEETWEPLRFNRSVSIIPGVVQRVSIEFGEV